MRHADPDQLQAAISGVIQASALAKRFRTLTVDEEEFRDGGEFLRVQIHVADINAIDDDDIDALVSSIENTVNAVDDRFPSVRFSEI